MAEARVRVVAVPPGGAGLMEGIRHAARQGSLVTGYQDSQVRLVSNEWADDREVEFLPFGDLVGRVVRMSGGEHDRLVTRGQREAMVELACLDLDGESALARGARLRGMPRLVAERLDELAQSGVGLEEIKSAARAASPHLASKLDALSRVAELVQDSSEVSHRETLAERIASCLHLKLQDRGPLDHVVVLAGDKPKPVADQWLRWLAEQGVEVDIVVELVPTRSDLFKDAQRTIARFPGAKRKVLGEKRWYEALFAPETAACEVTCEVFTTSDVLAECEWIVRQCASLGEQGGRTGIYVRDAETYVPLLVASAARFGVVLGLKRTVPLLSCGFAALTLDILRAAASRDGRYLAQLCSSSYLRATREQARTVERLVREARRAKSDPWASVQAWNLGQEEALLWLQSLCSWRQAAAAAAHPLSKWLELLRQLVGDSALADTAPSGDPTVDERDQRGQTVLQRAIADHAFVYDQAGGRELSLSGFVELAQRVWQEETVTFGASQGKVSVFSEPEAAPAFDTLFVPGMLEGTIPARRREDALLDDEERKELGHLLGVDLDDSRALARREHDAFVRLCAAASQRLVFSYALTDEDRDNIPSFYVDEVDRALGGRVLRVDYKRSDWVPPALHCGLEVDRTLRLALDSPRTYPSAVRVTAPEVQSILQPDWEAGIEPEELGRVLTCPFQSAVRDRLHIVPNDLRAGTAVLLDLPRRSGLATAADPEVALEALRTELDHLVEELSGRLEEWEIGLLRSTGDRWAREWVDREFRSREVWPRGESCSDVGLDERGLKNKLRAGDGSVRVRARVAGLTSVSGCSVAQVYRPLLPRSESFEAAVREEEGAFVAGVYLMTQYRRLPGGFALEVDGTSDGKRTLALVTGGQRPRSDQGAGLVVESLSDSPMRVLQAVGERLESAVKEIKSATARPNPGPHCTSCAYGTLCRRSAELGDLESPFGEDVA